MSNKDILETQEPSIPVTGSQEPTVKAVESSPKSSGKNKGNKGGKKGKSNSSSSKSSQKMDVSTPASSSSSVGVSASLDLVDDATRPLYNPAITEVGNDYIQLSHAIIRPNGISNQETIDGLQRLDQLSSIVKSKKMIRRKFPKTILNIENSSPVNYVVNRARNFDFAANDLWLRDPVLPEVISQVFSLNVSGRQHLPDFSPRSIASRINWREDNDLIEGSVPTPGATSSIKFEAPGGTRDHRRVFPGSKFNLGTYFQDTNNLLVSGNPGNADNALTTLGYYRDREVQEGHIHHIDDVHGDYDNQYQVRDAFPVPINNTIHEPFDHEDDRRYYMDIQTQKFILSINRMTNKLRRFARENVHLRRFPEAVASRSIFRSSFIQFVDFATFLYILMDSWKGNFSAVEHIGKKLGIVDSTLKFFINQSNNKKDELETTINSMLQLFDFVPVNMEVINRWNEVKHLAKMRDLDVDHEENPLLSPAFKIIGDFQESESLGYFESKDSYNHKQLVFPFGSLMQNFFNLINIYRGGRYFNVHDKFYTNEEAFGNQYVRNRSLRHEGIDTVISYSRMTAFSYNVMRTIFSSFAIPSLINEFITTSGTWWEILKEAGVYADTCFGFVKPEPINIRKYSKINVSVSPWLLSKFEHQNVVLDLHNPLSNISTFPGFDRNHLGDFPYSRPFRAFVYNDDDTKITADLSIKGFALRGRNIQVANHEHPRNTFPLDLDEAAVPAALDGIFMHDVLLFDFSAQQTIGLAYNSMYPAYGLAAFFDGKGFNFGKNTPNVRLYFNHSIAEYTRYSETAYIRHNLSTYRAFVAGTAHHYGGNNVDNAPNGDFEGAGFLNAPAWHYISAPINYFFNRVTDYSLNALIKRVGLRFPTINWISRAGYYLPYEATRFLSDPRFTAVEMKNFYFPYSAFSEQEFAIDSAKFVDVSTIKLDE